MDLLFWIVLWAIISSMGNKKKRLPQDLPQEGATPANTSDAAPPPQMGGLPESPDALRREILRRIRERQMAEAPAPESAPAVPASQMPRKAVTKAREPVATPTHRREALPVPAMTENPAMIPSLTPSQAAANTAYALTPSLTTPPTRHSPSARRITITKRKLEEGFVMAEILGKPKGFQ